MTKTHSVTAPRTAFRPFSFPWAYDLWKMQQQVHWLPAEVPLGEDIQDWNNKLTPAERNLVTQIFRFFTQSDLEVENAYNTHYIPLFKPPEIQMMLNAFINMETIHVDAYSHLLETIGMDATEYDAFLNYKEMKDKFDYMRSFDPKNPFDQAITMWNFGGLTEGLQLFASFAMLMNFPRFNKLKGMGQIVSWSVRDESLHCEGVAQLFKAYCNENGLTGNRDLIVEAHKTTEINVKHEDAFIDLAFEMGPIEGLTPDEMKQYIRYIANIRLGQFGLPTLYNVPRNPLPWLTVMMNAVEHANFFEARATEYTKSATEGSWENAF